MKYSLFRGLVILFLSVGCAVGPDYQKPQTKIPKSIQKITFEQINHQDLNVKWWESFKDPILNQLISKSVENNKSVKQALSRVNQSRAMARVAFADLLPLFQINNSYEERQLSGVQFGGNSIDYDLYRSSIDASWELDIFGRLRRNLEASEADYDTAIAKLDDAILILLSDLATNYFSLRSAQEQFLIAKNNLKIQKETVRIVTAKFNAGAIGELDLAMANTQLAQTTSTLAPLKALVKSYVYRISVLSGKNPTRYRNLLKKVTPIPEYQGVLQIGKVEDILQRRPDIRSAEHALIKYNALIGVETGNFFPKVSIVGDFGYEHPKFDNLYDSANEVYGYGPSISWTPFDFGSIRSRVKSADERAKEALYFYEETVLKALEDLKNACNNYRAQAERTYHLEKAFNSSKKAYQLSQAQYQVGTIDLLSVLEAQAKMLSSEDALAINKQSLATAVVNIYKALGGGWEAWQIVSEK